MFPTRKTRAAFSHKCMGARKALGLSLLASLAACSEQTPEPPAPPTYGPATLHYQPASFQDINGWPGDELAAPFSAFLKSCAVIVARAGDSPANPLENLGAHRQYESASGKVSDWTPACNRAAAIDATRDEAIRQFFEAEFQPLLAQSIRQAENSDGPPALEAKGKFTGYFEPQYSASREATAQHNTPVYGRPGDLIDVNLGQFDPALKGERIAGRVENGRLVPYADHAEINAGALKDNLEPLLWMDPNDLLFLQIQGSGQLRFDDNEMVRLGYAAQNGHAYTAIGRVLVEREIMPVEQVTMQSIRQWLETAPTDASRDLREQNKSYVFFRALDELSDADGPLGAQGIPLTPEYSLAVDRRFHMLGAPVFVDIEPINKEAQAIRRLMIAQDTGGAIRGPVRGDFFWGAGEKAATNAGIMNAQGQMYVLVPTALGTRLLDQNANAGHNTAP